MIKRLQTIEEVISELGGPEAVRQLTRKGAISAVPMWKVRQKFPASTFVVMQDALRERGAIAPNDLWGMS